MAQALSNFRLSSGGRKEAIVYVSGDGLCGTCGCGMYILEKNGSRLKLRGRTICLWPPIAILGTRTHGWRDIAVLDCEGAFVPCHRAKLQFDGWKYLNNPSSAYAVHGHPLAQVVIRSDKGTLPVYESTGLAGPGPPADR